LDTYLADSSAWVEYLADGPKAREIEKYLQDIEAVLVPSIVLFEVYRHFLRRMTEEDALMAAVQLKRGIAIEFDHDLAIASVEIGNRHGLALADSIIYALALKFGAKLITLDNDFRSLEGCIVL
jgi:toxin FitB